MSIQTTLPAPTQDVVITNSQMQEDWALVRQSGIGDLLASYNLVLALNGLYASGWADLMRSGAGLDPSALPDSADPAFGRGLLRYLAVRGVVAERDGAYHLTERGQLLAHEVPQALLGYYHESYSPVLRRIPDLLDGSAVYGRDVERDGEALGRHCEVLFRSFGGQIVLDILAEIGSESVLDLGCGTGGFLIDICRANPDLTAIGLDISEPAVRFGEIRVREEGLSDRIEMVVGDAFRPETWPEACERADTLLTVGTLHEHFRNGEDAVVELLNRYAEMMGPGSKGMILAEPELYCDDKDADFYLIHTFTRQGFPRPRDRWLELFERTGLECRAMYRAPNTGFRFVYFHLTPR